VSDSTQSLRLSCYTKQYILHNDLKHQFTIYAHINQARNSAFANRPRDASCHLISLDKYAVEKRLNGICLLYAPDIQTLSDCRNHFCGYWNIALRRNDVICTFSCLQLLQCHSKLTVSVLSDVHLHADNLLNCMNLLILYLIICMNLRVVFVIFCICLFVVFMFYKCC